MSTLATGRPLRGTVSDLTEGELIDRIQSRLAPTPEWLTVGIGDDAAIVEPERNRLEALTVDALVEGIHFDRAFTPPEAIGHRALAVNLSDLAAMGAAPRLALLSVALPGSLPIDDFDAIIGGLLALADRHRVQLVGGNLSRSPGPLMLDVTAIGSVKPRRPLRRGGARPGDDVYVSGTIGAAVAGLQMLRTSTAVADSSSHDETCLRRYLYPDPRVRLGVLLGRNRAATACIDLSDGLADGLRRMAEASRVGMVIEGAALPIDRAARLWFESRGGDAIDQAMAGGDDYELLVTSRPRWRGRLAATTSCDTPLTRIGVCTTDSAIIVRRAVDGAAVESELATRGYSHFR